MRFENSNQFIPGCGCRNCRRQSCRENTETIVYPSENIVRHTTNTRTVKKIHPIHIENIRRNVTRVENFYPVTESVRDINIVEEYNCGSNPREPRCRRR